MTINIKFSAEPGAYESLKRAIVGGSLRPDDPAIRGGAHSSCVIDVAWGDRKIATRDTLLLSVCSCKKDKSI